MNLRGEGGNFLEKNVLEIVLAVVIILILVGGAFLFYRNLIVSSDVESAKTTMNVIEGKIRALREGEKNSFFVRGVNAADWYLFGWGKFDSGRPDRCYFENCVCLCKLTGRGEKEDCQDRTRAFCGSFEEERIFVEGYDYSLPRSVDVGVGAPGIRLPGGVEVRNRILMTSAKLVDLEIERGKDEKGRFLRIRWYSDLYRKESLGNDGK